MPSLKFKNLQLIEASSVLRFAQEIDFNFSTLVSMWQELKDRGYANVTHFQGGVPVLPFAFSIGPGVGAQFLNDRQDTGVRVGSNDVQCAWRRAGTAPEYDGFEAMREILKLAHEALGKPHVSITTMAYTNLDQTGQPLSRVIHLPSVGDDFLDSTVDLNVARKLPSGVELRLQVARAGEHRLIVTTGGVQVPPNANPFDSLTVQVHDLMQTEFLNLITDYAKEAWQYDGIA